MEHARKQQGHSDTCKSFSGGYAEASLRPTRPVVPNAEIAGWGRGQGGAGGCAERVRSDDGDGFPDPGDPRSSGQADRRDHADHRRRGDADRAGLEPRYIAASDASALRYREAADRTGRGAVPGGLQHRRGDLGAGSARRGSASRSSRRGRSSAGLAAVFTFPLRHGDVRLGALDLYRETPGRCRPSR